jgi:hypothetical protein
VFLYAIGGIYALSVVDALFFFPPRSEGGFAILSPWGQEGPSLTLGGVEEGEVHLAVSWSRSGGVE